MNRGLPANLALCCIALCTVANLALASSARAADDFVILGKGNAFWTNDKSSPVTKALTRLQKNNEGFHSVAFNGEGKWVVLTQGNGFYTNDTSLPVCQKLAELQRNNDTVFKSVALSPDGGWSILWNQNGNWTIDAPAGAFERLQDVLKDGSTIRSVSFGPNGQWVILFDKTGVVYGGVPADLKKVLNDAVEKNQTVRCVAFGPRGLWICLMSTGWRTNNVGHPASKMIAALLKKREDLQWVAVGAKIGPHDFQKWADYIHGQCDGKQPGGYAFEVFQKGKLVASGAEGWARAPTERDSPSVKWTLSKPMGIASVSKTVTAVSLLKLWEETGQKFSLDDPFWPKIRAVCPQAASDVKKVTIRELLQHRTGFKKGVGDFTSPKDIEKLLVMPLAYPHGTHYDYDNNNFYIARLVIEQIGHVQYTPYVKSHVLQPMGITRMETRFQAQAPTCGYGKPGTTRPGYPFDWNCDSTGGAAGWYASANDIGRFLLGLRDHKVLTAATTEMMYRDMLGWDESRPGYEKNGGWFWDEGTAAGSRAGAFLSSIYHFPDDVDAVMLMNCDAPTIPQNLLKKGWLTSMEE